MALTWSQLVRISHTHIHINTHVNRDQTEAKILASITIITGINNKISKFIKCGIIFICLDAVFNDAIRNTFSVFLKKVLRNKIHCFNE